MGQAFLPAFCLRMAGKNACPTADVLAVVLANRVEDVEHPHRLLQRGDVVLSVNNQTIAKTRDLEKAPSAYTSMTLGCVRCHRYVARARVVK